MKHVATSASYSFTIRLRIRNRPGMLAKVLQTIARHAGDPGAVDVVQADRDAKIRDLTVDARDETHAQVMIAAIRRLHGIEVEHVSDRVFLLHRGGKIQVQSKIPLTTRDALSMAYTPGVARVCLAIAADKRLARQLTIKHNAVAVVTDGSAVLGLGNIGPEAALPVMEGKAMLFKEFGDVDAYPLCLATQDVDEIVRTVQLIAPGFGGINLEDISAPRCFEIERRLRATLDIPVFHDDQHGTAVVVLAATFNALKLVKRELARTRIVIQGAGAAGVAIARMLRAAGARDLVCCDRQGIIGPARLPALEAGKRWLAEHTNPRRLTGGIVEAATGAHLYIGVSGPGVFPVRALRRMARGAIVFALANPVPEIMPELAERHARIVATGRSDYPNQINNALVFPGIFRGALNAHAPQITEAMKLAAARAIAGAIPREALSEEYIVPSVFNKDVARRVARAVAQVAGLRRRAARPPV